jgi:hypothetical protein
MVTSASTLLSPRRIGVTGAVKMTKVTEHFVASIGRELARRHATVVTRGGAPSGEAPRGELTPIDKAVVDAAVSQLARDGRRPEDWIETVISQEASKLNPHRKVFRTGSVRDIRGRSYDAERFAFVSRLDGLITVGGRGGTEHSLILAMAIDIPVLPAPTFGGSSSSIWGPNRPHLARRLALDEEDIARWVRAPRTSGQAERLADDMVGKLFDSMKRRCFVVMPFQENFTALYDFVIEQAISACGDEPIRLDRAGIPGDVGRQIDDGLANADYVIVVLDGLRPNVLYELGVAHGLSKPTILLHRRPSDEQTHVPFDLTRYQRIDYEEIDASLPQRLLDSIRELPLSGQAHPDRSTTA